jgi:uncharacterized protein DUF4190
VSQLPPNQPASYTPSGARYNSLAIVSLVIGVASLFGHVVVPGLGGGVLALSAIITGLIARGEIKRSGEQGLWMAWVGIVIGLIHFLLLILLVFLIIAGVFVLGGIALFHH